MEKFLADTSMELLSENHWGQVFQTEDSKNSGKKVLVHLFKHLFFSMSERAQVRKKFKRLIKISHPGIVKPVELLEQNEGLAVVTESVPHPSLEEVLQNQGFELEAVIRIGTALGEILAAVHQADLFHGEISPSNIYINPETLAPQISSFNIVINHILKNSQIHSPEVIRRELVYMSPEQTGRMNRWVDFRTDLYSLGVVLYEMLTGQPPFVSKDPMDVVYSHIAIAPEPPGQLNPDVPEMVSRILLKLLNKNGEERYQNSLGFTSDFKTCLQQLEQNGRISDFEPGLKDIPRRFQLPQKIFGREKEIDFLLNAFRQTCEGARQVVMVEGQPGMGKSALVNEIHKPVVGERAFFICGKYEQYRKDTPYSALIQALKGLVRQILSQSDARIAEWKKTLNEATAPNGRVITEIVGDFELVMGEQPLVYSLGPEETRNRFHIVFEKFIQVFAKANHPLVIFLDDLQWADPASLEMLEAMACSHELAHLMIIGAFRGDEVDQDHFLSVVLDRIKEKGTALNILRVGPLSAGHVADLIHANLKAPEDQCRGLGDLVFQKTGGNPFFVNQFIKTLYDDRLIRMKVEAKWEWDIRKIEEMQVTDNLVALLVEKINRLGPETRDLLKICACIGNRFDPEMIAFLEEKPVEDVLDRLEEAIHEGLIHGSGNHYCYHHDRIHEAAYSLLEKEEKGLIHYRVGRKVAGEHTDRPLNGQLFYVADQLNAGVEWVRTDMEKHQLVQFNVDAGKKAKASAAYDAALEYFRMGLRLSGDRCWEDRYEEILDIFTQMAEVHYLTGDFNQMQECLDTGMKKAKTAIDRSWFCAIKIKYFTSNNQPEEALKVGIEILADLGVHLPAAPDDAVLLAKLQDIMGRLAGKSDDDLLDIPEMQSPEMVFASRIIHEMSMAAYIVSREFSSVMWLEMIRTYLEYGRHPVGASAFVSYGVIMIVGLGDIHAGVRFGNLAFKILEKTGNKNLLSAVSSTYNLLIRHWVDPVERSAAAGLEIHKIALETGDVEIAATGLLLHDTYSITRGTPLAYLEKTMERHHRKILKLKQYHLANYHSLYLQLIRSMSGKNKNPLQISLDGVDETSLEKELLEKKDYTFLCNFYLIKAILFFLFEAFEESMAFLEKAEVYQTQIRGLVNSSHLVFLSALTRLAVMPSRSEADKAALMGVVDANLAQLEHWRSCSPVNFEHRCRLIQAIKKHLSGDEIAAIDLYDEAIEFCHKNGIESEAVYCSSLAGYFFHQSGRTRLARMYIQDAYHSNMKIGRHALVEHYIQKYPFLEQPDSGGATETEANASETASRMLDMDAVLKASQAMSGEIVLGRLLKRMMQIAIENAGARQGCMILNDNGALLVEAEYGRDDKKEVVLQESPVDQHVGLSRALVQYAARTKETIILDHACEQGDFIQDAYFKAHSSKSVLCHPIVSQGRLLGLLYLENNLATGAFTLRHLEVLKIIGAQAAISIENARLYANLEQKVQERTMELENAYEKIKLLANTDPLTQLSNRRDMLEKIEAEIHRMERSGETASLILCDIDDFKQINDMHGHDCGDFVLKTLAEIMRSSIRNQDIVARWGGEEFLFFLPQTDSAGARTIAEKVRKVISEMDMVFDKSRLSVSMTFGVSELKDLKAGVNKVLKQADDALYEGKKSGKNQVVLSG